MSCELTAVSTFISVFGTLSLSLGHLTPALLQTWAPEAVCSAGPGFPESELMTSMTRKMQELEQQVQAQTDEILSKVGPQVGGPGG